MKYNELKPYFNQKKKLFLLIANSYRSVICYTLATKTAD